MPEPLELTTLKQAHQAEVQAFAREVDQFLDSALQILDDACLLDAVSARLTLQAMRHAVLDKFAQQLRQRPQDDPCGCQQLLREAYDLLMNPDSRLDLRDWSRAAAPFVRN